MVHMSEHEIPAGMRPDAGETWPPPELIDSFLGNFDFEFRPGEEVDLPDDEARQQLARRFRDVLGRYCSGVTVVTSVADGEPLGLTCQSFASVSLDPPLVAFMPGRTSRAWPRIRATGHFCVNFLTTDQVGISNTMASRGVDKFDGVAWSHSKTGSAVLDGVLGYVDCTIQAVHEAGDHYIVVGLVQDMDFTADADGTSPDPLLYYQGAYRTTR